MEQTIVRDATRSDMQSVLDLIVELAVYEKEPDAVIVTVEDLQRDGFGDNQLFECFVAEHEGKVVGFAIFYVKYSTWKGPCIYLEDLCVSESMRGKGIGALLFEKLIRESKDRGYQRMDWQVLDWNEPAINFYKKYNAELDPEWLNGRFSAEYLANY